MVKAKEQDAWKGSEIDSAVVSIQKSAVAGDVRFSTKALRAAASMRSQLNADVLASAIRTHIPHDNTLKAKLLDALGKSGESMEVDAKVDEKHQTVLPEVEIFIAYLVLLVLHDKQQTQKGLVLSTFVVQEIHNLNRRSLDNLASKVFFYFERFHAIAGRLTEIRQTLLAAQRTATLRHDMETQAVLLNLILRNYIHYNLYDQADKLVSKTVFPETAANNQSARYLYYLGRIKAVQLDYTAAHRHLLQAIRKAPQNTKTAGFLQAVNKLSIIVQLLTGEIPERSVFRQAMLRKPLLPYLEITQAVRIGDLGRFQDTLAKYSSTFKEDKTYTLILRLRHNVIKTGIRMISLSYSKISLRDICVKLQLDSEEDAEYIVAKAIRDGVIDAVIDHEHGFMKSKENVDVYSTNEPLNAFHQRINFCLNIHNEAVKAMRFKQTTQQADLALVDAIREEERNLSSELAEGDFQDDGDEDF